MDASGLSVASAATADAMESDLDVSGHNLTAAITGTLTPPPSATVPPQQTLEDLEAKRKKRLELNRKAAQESRRRKKMKVEELQRNVAALTQENEQLQAEHDRLTEELRRDDPETSGEVDAFQAQNAALRLAIYEEIERLVGAMPPSAAGE
jgi:predicted RNase H-like nuclease (RuvC/YqgF family)